MRRPEVREPGPAAERRPSWSGTGPGQRALPDLAPCAANGVSARKSVRTCGRQGCRVSFARASLPFSRLPPLPWPVPPALIPRGAAGTEGRRVFSRAGRHGEGHRLDVGPSAGSSAPSPERRSVRMTSPPSERSTSARRAAATRCGRSGSPTPPGGATRARAVSASGGTGSGGFDARVRCRREDDPAPRQAPALRPTAVVPEPAGGDALPSASSRAAEDAEDPGAVLLDGALPRGPPCGCAPRLPPALQLPLDQRGQTLLFRLAPAAGDIVVPFHLGRSAVVAFPHGVDDILEERVDPGANRGQRLLRQGGHVPPRHRPLDAVGHGCTRSRCCPSRAPSLGSWSKTSNAATTVHFRLVEGLYRRPTSTARPPGARRGTRSVSLASYSLRPAGVNAARRSSARRFRSACSSCLRSASARRRSSPA